MIKMKIFGLIETFLVSVTLKSGMFYVSFYLEKCENIKHKFCFVFCILRYLCLLWHAQLYYEFSKIQLVVYYQCCILIG